MSKVGQSHPVLRHFNCHCPYCIVGDKLLTLLDCATLSLYLTPQFEVNDNSSLGQSQQ